MGPHLLGLVRPQQIGLQLLRLAPREPAIVVPRMEDHRYSVMDLRGQLNGVRFNNCKRLEPLPVRRILPRVPQSRKRERLGGTNSRALLCPIRHDC